MCLLGLWVCLLLPRPITPVSTCVLRSSSASAITVIILTISCVGTGLCYTMAHHLVPRVHLALPCEREQQGSWKICHPKKWTSDIFSIHPARVHLALPCEWEQGLLGHPINLFLWNRCGHGGGVHFTNASPVIHFYGSSSTRYFQPSFYEIYSIAPSSSFHDTWISLRRYHLPLAYQWNFFHY
jgi:hypothetical protein